MEFDGFVAGIHLSEVEFIIVGRRLGDGRLLGGHSVCWESSPAFMIYDPQIVFVAFGSHGPSSSKTRLRCALRVGDSSVFMIRVVTYP